MRELNIRWQRLVDATNQTCDRCGATGAAVERAVGMLTRGLKELDVEVILKMGALDSATFAQAPLESNRIWIGGLPLEPESSDGCCESQENPGTLPGCALPSAQCGCG